MFSFLGHSGESPQGFIEVMRHWVTDYPVFSAGLILGVGSLILILIYEFSHSASAVLIASLVELFLIGILTYTFLPAVSAVALIVGFCLALWIVLAGMTAGK